MIALAFLLFGPQELAPLQAPPQHVQANILKLEGISYHSPENWAFWLNGTKVSPSQPSSKYDVISVSPDSIKIKVLGSDDNRKVIVLHPGKAYSIEK